jgi:multidrug efflux pump subunit AcrA (membrane-fusion protein)
MSSPDDLMSVREAADLAGKSLSTVRDWIRAGHLVKHREDPEDDKSKVLVSRAELVARIEEVGGPRPEPTPPGPGGSHPSTAPDAGLVAELASTRAVVAGLEERLRLVSELRESERARLEAVAESDRATLVSAREAFEKAREALESAAAAHLGAADAERRRADAAEEALRQTRDDLEVSRGELVAMRAELEALRVRNGLSWWRRMLTAGPAS